MPEQKTWERVRRDRAAGKSSATQAGEFVREEMHHIRKGKHGARSTKQAIAIGLSKARRAGINLPAPRQGTSSATRRQARRDLARGQSHPGQRPAPRRSQATLRALRREGHSAASRSALSREARRAARRRSPAQRSAAARKAAHTRRR